jgi:3-oxoadipate enol-lactonase
MARIQTAMGQIGYLAEGAGDALVFLHGVGSDKTVWTEQIAHFSRNWRAIALDYPGYGESDLPDHDLDRPAIGAALWAALDALGVAQVHLAGLSMGGVMALEMRRSQPERIRTLILADTFAWHPQAEMLVARSHTAIQQMTMREFAEARVSGLLAPTATEASKAAVIHQMGGIDKRTYYWSTLAVWTPDYRSDLARITQPTLILVGEHDHVTPPALSEALHAGIAGSRLVVIPAAGHISNLDNPTAFDTAISAFLAEAPPPHAV